MAPKLIEVTDQFVYIKHSDLRSDYDRFIGHNLCETLNNYVPGEVQVAQLVNRVWRISLRTNDARKYLLDKITAIKYKSRKIELFGHNPLLFPQKPSEKIIIRDLPIHIPNEVIMNFFEHNYPHVVTRSNVIMAQIPAPGNTLTKPVL